MNKAECYFCGFETNLHTVPSVRLGYIDLCDVCFSSVDNEIIQNPDRHGDILLLSKQISYIGNMIFDKIENKNKV